MENASEFGSFRNFRNYFRCGCGLLPALPELWGTAGCPGGFWRSSGCFSPALLWIRSWEGRTWNPTDDAPGTEISSCPTWNLHCLPLGFVVVVIIIFFCIFFLSFSLFLAGNLGIALTRWICLGLAKVHESIGADFDFSFCFFSFLKSSFPPPSSAPAWFPSACVCTTG